MQTLLRLDWQQGRRALPAQWLMALSSKMKKRAQSKGLGMQERAAESALGRSGFLAAFALIFASEIGDRTFFIAGLLAAKVGKWVAFTGTCLALGLMTVISVGIGYAFKCVPDALKSSAPIGEYAGVALMIFFGFRLLRVRPSRLPQMKPSIFGLGCHSCTAILECKWLVWHHH